MHHTIIPNKTPSSSDLVEYLDKENNLSKEESLAEKFINYLDKETVLSGDKINFFNSKDDDVDKYIVASSIDKNCRKLSRNEARFYSVTIDPSAKEIQHIKEIAGMTANSLIQSGVQGSYEYIQEQLCRTMFQEYARNCMDEYARNFNRENVKSGNDLVWFGRVEKNRYWKSKSPEVQHNRSIYREIKKQERKPYSSNRDERIAELEKSLIKEKDVRDGGKDLPIVEMMPKSGDNYHIHVIVSRRDKEQQYKLSPLSASMDDREHKVGGRKCTIGFNRNAFTNKIEAIFDNTTGYTREDRERYETLKMNKKELDKEFEIGKSEDRTERESGTGETHYDSGMASYTMNKLAYEAGIEYVRKEIKPYRTAVSLGSSGIKILLANKTAKEKAASLTKSITKHFVHKLGVTIAPELMSSISLLQTGKMLSGILKSNREGQER